MKNLLFLFLLFPLPLMAQVERESPGPVDVSGRVVNVSGEALPGASLWLVNQVDTLKKFGVSTRDDGTYALVLCNDKSEAKGITVDDGNRHFTYEVPAKAIVSYRWDKE